VTQECIPFSDLTWEAIWSYGKVCSRQNNVSIFLNPVSLLNGNNHAGASHNACSAVKDSISLTSISNYVCHCRLSTYRVYMSNHTASRSSSAGRAVRLFTAPPLLELPFSHICLFHFVPHLRHLPHRIVAAASCSWRLRLVRSCVRIYCPPTTTNDDIDTTTLDTSNRTKPARQLIDSLRVHIPTSGSRWVSRTFSHPSPPAAHTTHTATPPASLLTSSPQWRPRAPRWTALRLVSARCSMSSVAARNPLSLLMLRLPPHLDLARSTASSHLQ
jgi:hypothetical protein